LNVRLLVTRPEADAERTASALRARGHLVTVAPLLRIEALQDAKLGSGPWAAILVTSANAASAIARHPRGPALKNVPALAVGEHSAQAMRGAGFITVASADGNVDDLANLVAARLKPPARLLYLTAEDRAGDLAGTLRALGFVVDVVVVYRAVAAETLPPKAAAALTGGIDGVLHFSRRSAEAYVNTARGAGLLEAALKPQHFVLSAQVAEPLAQAGAADIRVAPQPNEVALIELIPVA
jgi:uroporphyrinogen-III synthase